MAISSKQRAVLRGEAHHLTATVHVGQHGLTDALRQSVDDALRTHELVKVHLVKRADISAKQAANELAAALGAEVVQVIGRTTSLYRENPELDHRTDKAPAWRR
jgi:RNA-binding protein